jgi:Putative bacterial sensory transduction regulator
MQRFLKILVISLSAQLFSSSVLANATELRTLLSARPANIMSALGDIGYALAARQSPDGNDMLEDTQQRFVIFLGQCSKSSCKLVQARVCFNSANASAKLANLWNSTQMFGRAAMQADGVMCIDNTLYAADGLVSISQLRSQIEAVIAMRPVAENFFAEG